MIHWPASLFGRRGPMAASAARLSGRASAGAAAERTLAVAEGALRTLVLPELGGTLFDCGLVRHIAARRFGLDVELALPTLSWPRAERLASRISDALWHALGGEVAIAVWIAAETH